MDIDTHGIKAGIENGWEEILAPYKTEKNTENLAVLFEDPKLTVLALAWTKIPKKLKAPPSAADLEALWDCVSFDYEDLEDGTNLTILQVINGMKLLRRHQLIFPDGSLRPEVSALIRNRIFREIKGKNK
ncbi:MAG: hypothetical protein JRI57_11150 [Deltaproteobacteria bacterium]|nr:hypothetical protein [Deltaproteobacteria bacterium]